MGVDGTIQLGRKEIGVEETRAEISEHVVGIKKH